MKGKRTNARARASGDELHAANVRQLALRLSEAEAELQALASGGLDSFVDPNGKTHLLRGAQEQLRRNEARLQALLESVPDVITVINCGGTILSESVAVKRVLGYEQEELVGRTLFELVHPDDLAGFYCAFSDVTREIGPTATVEFRHRTRDGSWRRLEAVLGTLYERSEPAGMILTLRDLSGRRHELDRSSPEGSAHEAATRTRNRFVAMLSHELRTPLTPALLGIDALQEDSRFDEAKPMLEMIRRNIELESRLLEEMSVFSQIAQGKLRLRLESVDAHAAVRNVLEICQSDLAARQIDVRLDFRAAESHVRADSTELQQIVWNLVKNAVKFSRQGGALTIASSNDASGGLTLEFTDNGIGIDPALAPLIFDSFQQGDRWVHGGLGLGLFIAKGLAEAQDGALTVFSEGRGKGATFRLALKTAPAKEPPSPGEPREPALADKRLQILLVEDHDDTRTALESLLKRRGHAVLAAPTMRAGLTLAQECRCDLLISDIGLPDGTGHELMERLRVGQPSIRAIAMSGFAMQADIEQSRNAGFAEHLVKPVAFELLHSVIQKLATAEG